jgi:cellulose synthase/poly-beta-1,6-N-acetylglucosamine synthase-like glycosyltransferase
VNIDAAGLYGIASLGLTHERLSGFIDAIMAIQPMTNSMNERTLNTIVSATTLTGPEITIVLPTYNERANVRPMVDTIARTLADTRWEIIFVDDDSPDGTTAEARAIGATDHVGRHFAHIQC